MPVTTAAGTNILVSSLSAMSGSYRHLREKRVDLRVVLAMGIPSVAGAFAGAFWSRNAPESLLLGAIILLVAWQGGRVRADGPQRRRCRQWGCS